MALPSAALFNSSCLRLLCFSWLCVVSCAWLRCILCQQTFYNAGRLASPPQRWSCSVSSVRFAAHLSVGSLRYFLNWLSMRTDSLRPVHGSMDSYCLILINYIPTLQIVFSETLELCGICRFFSI